MLAEERTSLVSTLGWHRPPERANPLIERLSRFVSLDAPEIQAIRHISRHSRRFQAHDTLIHQESRPNFVCLIVSGIAFRYRYLPDGRRQIFGYLLPGDLCDTHFVISNQSDHSVGLLCDSVVAMISTSELMEVMVNHPRIERALLMTSLVEAAVMREWLLNVGQRDAIQKLSHFFCEMAARLHSIGDVNPDGSFSIPITQTELADTIGLTPVHVNRSLQRLRREGLVVWTKRRLTIVNRDLLEMIAGFDEAYLQLRPEISSPKLCAYG